MAESTMSAEDHKEKFDRSVGITLAVVATIMSIFGLIDNNIVQDAQVGQLESADTWNYFQAKSTKQSIAKNSFADLKIEKLIQKDNATVASAIQERMDALSADIKRYETEKDSISKLASQQQSDSQRGYARDDWFDRGDALFSMALLMLALATLIQQSWPVWIGIVASLVASALDVVGTWFA